MPIKPHPATLRGYAPAGVATAVDVVPAPIPVRVLADDAVTRDAMLACLRSRPETRVLINGDAEPARVVLILADRITDATLDRMQDAVSVATNATTPTAATTLTVGAASAAANTIATAPAPAPAPAPSASAAVTPPTAAIATPPLDLGFVLVGDGLRAHHLLAAIAHGPLSVIARRDADTDRVVRAVVGVPAGRLELPDDAVGWLVARLRAIHRDVLAPRGLTAAGLGTREVEVLRLLAEGLDTAEIAQAMNYSERTVKSIIHGVLTRCRLRNRAHAVAFALRSGAL